MPPAQNPHRKNHRGKLQRAEIRLVAAQIAAHALRRFREPETRAEVDEQASGDEGEIELLVMSHRAASDSESGFAVFLAGFVGAVEEDGEQDEEDEKGKDLEG